MTKKSLKEPFLSLATLIEIHNWFFRKIFARPNSHFVEHCGCPNCDGLVATSFPEKMPLCGHCDRNGCLCNEC